MAAKDNKKRTIVLPISEQDYKNLLSDAKLAKDIIQNYVEKSPELFPLEINKGFKLNGKTRMSKKMGIFLQKIRVGGVNYQIRPSYILPYMRGETQEASKGLFLMRFGVPFWALAVVFGKNAMWWYRLYIMFSSYSIVGTTIKKKELLPKDILADEHHIYHLGEKAYVATTVGSGCFLGVSACSNSDKDSLMEGYGVFKEEASLLDKDYSPNTVNTDGWWATQNAWKALYTTIVIIECFLHAFLKVKDRATKKLEPYYKVAGDKIWNCYRALNKRELAQKIRRLAEWANNIMPTCPMKEHILKICKKKENWMAHLDNSKAHRTSNMLDRLMKTMSRHAYNSQMFHSSISKTTNNFRAFALLYNFSPSCPAAWDETKKLVSPAARLNGFVYHEDWLQNLLISASLGGYRQHSNPL